ncbi:hypothetical protein JCM1393_15960 [Clostridium carnis]
MKKKKKGFTLIELIIALSLTVVIMGVAYTFFFSNNRTLNNTEANSTLQMDGAKIQDELISIGTQTKEIISIDNNDSSKVNYNYDITGNNHNKLDISEIKLRFYDDTIYTFEYRNNELKLKDKNNNIKILSTNVKEFKIRPLDINMVDNKSNASFKEAPGIEFNITLALKKGYTNIEYPVNCIVKFRNKNIN